MHDGETFANHTAAAKDLADFFRFGIGGNIKIFRLNALQ